MAIKQLNGVDITLVERKDEFIYNELISSYVKDHLDGVKTSNNFAKYNPSESEPSIIIKFISGGLMGRINKMLILQCSELKVLERKMGDSKSYKGKIPTLFDELCKVLPQYRNVKVVVSVSEWNKTSKIYKYLEQHGKVIPFENMNLRQYISFAKKRCELYGIHMDNDVIKYLLTVIDNNYAVIDSEIKKLSLLDCDITRDVIRRNVIRSKKAIVFELTKAIGTRRYNASMDLLCELLEQGTSAIQIVALLQRTFRVLLYMHIGCDMAEFKLNKWSMQAYKEQSVKFTTDEIINVLEELIETERLLKSSSIKEGFLLGMLLMEII